MGKIQNAAGRATYAQAKLTTEVVDTALEIYSIANGMKGGGFNEEIASFANNNSKGQVSGKTSQSEGFKAKISGGGQ